MKVAILGTRGIPNNYGGFEQLAQFLSLGLKQRGYQLSVYSSSHHPYKGKEWNGVNIVHRFDPEKWMGSFGQFIYDLSCIWHARRNKFDVVLNLGYTSSSVWLWLLPAATRVITNMDGLEWKRTKYNAPVRLFLKYAEKLAVKKSHTLVADSEAIQIYLSNKYHVPSVFIAYGADFFEGANPDYLKSYQVEPYQYNILVARMEPENNIEMILDGIAAANSEMPFLVVGNIKNKFGAYIQNKFKSVSKIRFTGPVYEAPQINNLRYYSNLYFHGHSVGGTNPSLLESMGCSCLIAAHNNEFNRAVLGESAFYFSSVDEVKKIVLTELKTSAKGENFIINNLHKIKERYSWPAIVSGYEKVIINNGTPGQQ